MQQAEMRGQASQKHFTTPESKSSAPTGIVLGATYLQNEGDYSRKFVFDSGFVAVSAKLVNHDPNQTTGAGGSKQWAFETTQGLRVLTGNIDHESKDIALANSDPALQKTLIDQYHLQPVANTQQGYQFKIADLDRVAKFRPGDWIDVIRVPYNKAPYGKPGQIVIDSATCKDGTLCWDVLSSALQLGIGQVSPDGSRIDFANAPRNAGLIRQ